VAPDRELANPGFFIRCPAPEPGVDPESGRPGSAGLVQVVGPDRPPELPPRLGLARTWLPCKAAILGRDHQVQPPALQQAVGSRPGIGPLAPARRQT
jgi:hypothetical protein